MEVYDFFYLFHLRKHIRHYGECTTSPQEGVNTGMKHHRAPATPNLTLEHFSIIMSKNSVRSAKKLRNEYITIITNLPHTILSNGATNWLKFLQLILTSW